MRHLYATRAEVLRLSGDMTNGTPTLSWNRVDTVVDPYVDRPGELLCRLDLGYIRVGRDQPMAITAGRPPDRFGLMFFDATDEIQAGDRIRTLTGPIDGTFEIRAIPDVAADMATAHHMEVQVFEVTASAQTTFPGGRVEESISEYLP